MKSYFLLCFLCLIFSVSHSQSYLGWTTANVNLRSGPGSDYKKISTLESGEQIFIESLNSNNEYVSIIDIATNQEGFISKKYIKVGSQLDYSSDGILQPTGQITSQQPEIEIFNNTDRALTLKMNEKIFTFYSRERKTFNLPAGQYEYRASAPGVIPDIGNENISSNTGYSWEFYIITY